MKADLHDRVQITCDSHTESLWFAESLVSKPFYIGNMLVLISVNFNASGKYYCFGSYKNKKTFLAETELKVYGNLLKNLIIFFFITIHKAYSLLLDYS